MISAETRRALEARYYPDLEQVVFCDFQQALHRHLHPRALVLDAGSGPGSWVVQEARAELGMLIGADMYPPDTSHLDAFVMASCDRLPFVDHALDVIVSYLVLEHLPDPLSAYREFARVLKPGGALLFKTPAVKTPLFALAKLLPTWAHRRLKARIGTDEEDVFPTYYRANTVSRLQRELRQAGLERELLTTVDQTYAYLTHSRFSYILGLLYSRGLQRPWLAWLRNQIIGVYCLPEEKA